MGEYIIETERLEKTYSTKNGNICSVKNLDLKIHEKELVSIMGPSGCGKSTLLKMLGGIIMPTSGKIILHDNVYHNGIPREALKKLGFVFQNDNLLPWRTIKRNLDLPMEILKIKGEKWEKRTDELLDMVGLKAYKEAYPHELSGGMKQRIGVIRALVHDPDVLLMDQPFGALDTITRKMLSFDFLALWKHTQKTIIMVTNDIDEALLLSSRIYIMSHRPGQIIHVIDVDIPLSARNQYVTKNSRYKELRGTLKQLVKKEQEIAATFTK